MFSEIVYNTLPPLHPPILTPNKKKSQASIEFWYI